MALDKQVLADQFKSIFDGVSPEANGETDPDTLRQKVANELADAIDIFVKSATVTVASGITVSTTGTATAQTGQTINTGNGTIS
ncbi:hypothetical protein [Labilibaculum sp.]|uniref:hypothetical protein n=1 Tax=Labilibaculum sp. TaxID=2060723 RepID=UPI002AA8634D|nr:hypothetical protein [Labilibaculum sp.]